MSHDSAVRSWYAAPSRFAPMPDPIYKAIDHTLLDLFAPVLGDVLDLGCFYPETELIYARHAKKWAAIDFTPEVIAQCRALREWPSTVEFLHQDMRHLAFDDKSFDLVLDFSSGDHLSWEDWQLTVAEVVRVLRPGGKFICTYANATQLGGGDGSSDAFGYERWTRPEDMAILLIDNGMTIVHEQTSHVRSGIVAVRT